MITIMCDPFFTFLQSLPHRELDFGAQEMIVDIEAPVAQLFVIKRGQVHLLRYQKNGDPVVLQRAGAGEILAEASVFSTRYHCAAIAVSESQLLAYSMKEVRTLLAETPEAALAYARHLANEVREARKRSEILALKTVSERLSAWLTWNHGLLPERGAWHLVANEIGISKEALYRELSIRRQQKE